MKQCNLPKLLVFATVCLFMILNALSAIFWLPLFGIKEMELQDGVFAGDLVCSNNAKADVLGFGGHSLWWL